MLIYTYHLCYAWFQLNINIPMALTFSFLLRPFQLMGLVPNSSSKCFNTVVTSFWVSFVLIFAAVQMIFLVESEECGLGDNLAQHLASPCMVHGIAYVYMIFVILASKFAVTEYGYHHLRALPKPPRPLFFLLVTLSNLSESLYVLIVYGVDGGFAQNHPLKSILLMGTMILLLILTFLPLVLIAQLSAHFMLKTNDLEVASADNIDQLKVTLENGLENYRKLKDAISPLLFTVIKCQEALAIIIAYTVVKEASPTEFLYTVNVFLLLIYTCFIGDYIYREFNQ